MPDDPNSGIYFDSVVRYAVTFPGGHIATNSPDEHFLVTWEMRDGQATAYECRCGFVGSTLGDISRHCLANE